MHIKFHMEPEKELMEVLNKAYTMATTKFRCYKLYPEVLLYAIVNTYSCKAYKFLKNLLPNREDDVKVLSTKLDNYLRNKRSYFGEEKDSLPEETYNLIAEGEIIARSLGKNRVSTLDILLAFFMEPETYAFNILLEKINPVFPNAGPMIKFSNISYEEFKEKLIELAKTSSFREFIKNFSEEDEDYDEEDESYEDSFSEFFEEKAKSAKIKNIRHKTSILDKYSYDLTQLAREGKFDPIIGREKEIERVLQILCRRYKNNPVLIGEPGVGKTAIVEGLAQLIAKGEVPEFLKNKRIVSLDLPAIVAGTKYRGQFEERLKEIINEIRRNKNIIVFIDEIHTLIGTGSSEGSLDACNILKPALSRGEIQCIGATTLDEYRKYIEKDGALERRFQKIIVNPPSREETLKILMGLKKYFEEYHNVIYTKKALEAAVKCAERYVPDHFFPDKAIDIIDETGSLAKLRSSAIPSHIQEKKKNLEKIQIEKKKYKKKLKELMRQQENEKSFYDEKLSFSPAYEATLSKLAELSTEEKMLKKEIDREMEKLEKIQEKKRIISEDDVSLVVSKWTGIPLEKIKESESAKLLKLENELKKKIKGQDEAVKLIANTLRKARAGLKDPKRPMGVFLFLGYSGVGKTALAKALAEHLFDTEDALIRVDMSEYMEKFNVSRLVGAPPGYVGYEEGGTLTEKVRRQPFSIILLDEIEKAHSDVFNILLQIFDNGIITDSFGRKIDFRNTIIIMTSNLGTHKLFTHSKMGFSLDTKQNEITEEYKYLSKELKKELQKFFKPEFLNRIDNIVIFKPLSKETLFEIIDLFVEEINERLKDQNITIKLTDRAKDWIIEKEYNIKYGARPLKRALENFLEDKIVSAILRKEIKFDDLVIIDADKEGLYIKEIISPKREEEPKLFELLK